MINFPKICPASTTVDEARTMLLDDHHVHAVLVVGGGRLLAVVESVDLTAAPADAEARQVGRLDGRVVGPDADLDATWRSMRAGRRRLAVVDDAGRLLGLLCLKRSAQGFCTDAGVLARAQECRHRSP